MGVELHTGASIAFLFSAAFILYALIGYPVLLWILATRYPRSIRKEFVPRSVTILLPVHNGEKWIQQKLESILELDYPGERVQLLVISDGSIDATDAITSGFARRGVQLVHVPKGGKALALNKGLELAKGEIVFFTDVRQRLKPDCLRQLVTCFADPDVGGVCGELIILDGETQEELAVGMYWKVEKWIRRQLSRMGTLQVVTGCVYAIRRELAEPVPAGALGDDIFMPQAILRKGRRVVFEETAKAYDYPTTVNLEFQRKVRTLAGLYQYLGKHGLGRHWFHFFSYKISRLLLPYALIVVAVASFLLPGPFALLTVAAQVTFYGLAAIDPWIPERSAPKRLSSPARTFCMLMAASLWAASVLFVPPSDLWKTTQVRASRRSG